MTKELPEPHISVYLYFDTEKHGDDYLDRWFDEANDANAIYECDDLELDELYLNISQFDKHCLTRLKNLQDKALQSKSLKDAEEYDTYATDVYYDRHHYVEGMFLTLSHFPNELCNVRSESAVIIPDFNKFVEHFISAKNQLLDIKSNISSKSNDKKNGKS